MSTLPLVSPKSLVLLARNIALVFCLAMTIPFSARGADGGGLLGSLLTATQKRSDLFVFFHLEETGATMNDAGERVAAFKPSGPNFRPLVTLSVAVDKAGAISQVELLLARSFIDDETNGIFARDIAKSLLRDSVAGPGGSGAISLADEIEFHRGTDRPVLSAQPSPKLPDAPSPGYLVFLGKQKAFEQALSGGRLRLGNRMEGGVDVLAITVGRR